VFVDDFTVSHDALDDGTARISLAGVLSPQVGISGAQHDVRDLSVVAVWLVALIVGEVRDRDMIEYGCCVSAIFETALSHDDQVVPSCRNIVLEVKFEDDRVLVDSDGTVELAEGEIVVDAAASGSIIGILLVLLAKCPLGSRIYRPFIVRSNEDVIALKLNATMGRKENNVGSYEGSAASAHFDEIGIFAWIGFGSSHDASGGSELGRIGLGSITFLFSFEDSF